MLHPHHKVKHEPNTIQGSNKILKISYIIILLLVAHKNLDISIECVGEWNKADSLFLKAILPTDRWDQ